MPTMLSPSEPLYPYPRGPIVIGGLGGSGSRLIADIMMRSGVYMGSDLNEARDNLWFTFLFKRLEIRQSTIAELQSLCAIFTQLMLSRLPLTPAQLSCLEHLADSGHVIYSADWLDNRLASMRESLKKPPDNIAVWGWKEPNTHILLPRLLPHFSGMKYIHVVRNGLDMAFSRNQNQFRLWGPSILPEDEQSLCPRNALKFWCATQRNFIAIQQEMPQQTFQVNFDRLCENPWPELVRLLEFSGLQVSLETMKELSLLPQRPEDDHRYKQHDLGQLDPIDVQFVESLGFPVS